MSAKAVGWALDQDLDPLPKIVLVAVADCLNAETLKCCPSQEYIARIAHCSTRTIRTHLTQLEELGLLTRHRRMNGQGHRVADGYELHLTAAIAGGPTGSATSVLPETATSAQEPEVEPEPPMASAMRGTRAIRFRGRLVPAAVASAAVDALARYCEVTGQRVGPETGTGTPSESLKRIVGAMLEHPMLVDDWRRVVDGTLADPWWQGIPSVGVIFGPKVVERNMQSQSNVTPLRRGASAGERQMARQAERARRRDEALEREAAER